MRGSHYTVEQNAFITDHYQNMTYSKLADLYNQTFGGSMTAKKLTKKIARLGLPKKERTYNTLFSPEADQYLLEHAYDYTSSELAEQMYTLFGISCKTQTITTRLLKHGVRRDKCYVPKNYLPRACKPIGAERVDKNSVVMVKVAQPNVWKPKTQIVTNYDPTISQCIFLDGNSLNVVPENIMVVSKRVHARLAKNGWLNGNSEVIKTGIVWSELLYVLKDLESDKEEKCL